jgi:hypothetical protein
VAQRFGKDKEGFLQKGKGLGGEQVKYGDASVKLYPFPRIPAILTLWLEDEEFPARVDLMFDSTCDMHLATDIIWSIAMMCVLLHQGLCHGRVHADQALSVVGLIGPHDAVLGDTAIFILEPDPRTKKDPRFIIGASVDNDNMLQPFFQMVDAGINLAELFLSIDVLGILGPVSLGCSGGKSGRHFRTFDPPEVFEFIAQAFLPFGRDIFRTRLLLLSIPAHDGK